MIEQELYAVMGSCNRLLQERFLFETNHALLWWLLSDKRMYDDLSLDDDLHAMFDRCLLMMYDEAELFDCYTLLNRWKYLEEAHVNFINRTKVEQPTWTGSRYFSMAKLTKQQRQMYEEFVQEFPTCWLCDEQGLCPSLKAFYAGWNPIENSHIVGGAGRRADRRAIIRLCRLHHMAFDGHTIRNAAGKPVEGITIQNALWLKEKYDPSFYDVDFIKSLRHKKFEPLEPMPLKEQ